MLKFHLTLVMLVTMTVFAASQPSPTILKIERDGTTTAVPRTDLVKPGKININAFSMLFENCSPCANKVKAMSQRMDNMGLNADKIRLALVVSSSADPGVAANIIATQIRAFDWKFQVYLDTNFSFAKSVNINTFPYFIMLSSDSLYSTSDINTLFDYIKGTPTKGVNFYTDFTVGKLEELVNLSVPDFNRQIKTCMFAPDGSGKLFSTDTAKKLEIFFARTSEFENALSLNLSFDKQECDRYISLFKKFQYDENMVGGIEINGRKLIGDFNRGPYSAKVYQKKIKGEVEYFIIFSTLKLIAAKPLDSKYKSLGLSFSIGELERFALHDDDKELGAYAMSRGFVRAPFYGYQILKTNQFETIVAFYPNGINYRINNIEGFQNLKRTLIENGYMKLPNKPIEGLEQYHFTYESEDFDCELSRFDLKSPFSIKISAKKK